VAIFENQQTLIFSIPVIYFTLILALLLDFHFFSLINSSYGSKNRYQFSSLISITDINDYELSEMQ